MRRVSLFASLLFVLAVIAAACGGGSGGKSTPGASTQIQPISGNSELVVGPNRFTVAFIDQNNQRILESGNAVHLQFFDPAGALKNGPIFTASGNRTFSRTACTIST